MSGEPKVQAGGVGRAARARRGGQHVSTSPVRCEAAPERARNIAPADEEQVDEVHDASLGLLEEIGIEFMGRSAPDTFRAAGAIVDDDTGLVRIPREVVEAAVTAAPSEFTVTPRDTTRQIRTGGKNVAFGLVAGPPTVHDRVRGRRRATSTTTSRC